MFSFLIIKNVTSNKDIMYTEKKQIRQRGCYCPVPKNKKKGCIKLPTYPPNLPNCNCQPRRILPPLYMYSKQKKCVLSQAPPYEGSRKLNMEIYNMNGFIGS